MNAMSSSLTNLAAEWLETDGLGGFASGTMSGIRTRRYHALLLAASTPPTGRMVLVNGVDAAVSLGTETFALSSQYYAPGVLGGEGAQRVEACDWRPWPHWIFNLDDGARIEQEIFAIKDQPLTCVCWRLLGPRRDARLVVRPFLSGRDFHCLHKHNPAFCFDPTIEPGRVTWQPYPGVPGVAALTNGSYSHQPEWYYNFLYEQERARGLDCQEDLAAPGLFTWNLAKGEAVLLLTTRENAAEKVAADEAPEALFKRLRASELKRRQTFASPLESAGDAYIVRSNAISSGRVASSGAIRDDANSQSGGKTIIAGYPWFADWGRDTFIALRGLCLATGRLEDARQILLSWANVVSEGMLPNRFPDRGEQLEFNAVDASLWYILAVREFLDSGKATAAEKAVLVQTIEAILEGYSRGTRYNIRVDADGLLSAGERGVQLTWMDAKVGEWVVTPRAGKPVEIQALWLNALRIGAQWNARWQELFTRGLESFRSRFWNEAGGFLYDVVDVNHRSGEVDAAFRPNQIFAVGGLPFSLIEGGQAFQVVSAIESRLWTPLGLRSLAPGEPGYSARYEGGVRERDEAYHQGTVWPWLIGPFVEAWVRVRGETNAAKREARTKFLNPLLAHLEDAGLGHISEIADAQEPYTARGCPFQAWSVGEALRLDRVVLAESRPAKPVRSAARRTRELIPA